MPRPLYIICSRSGAEDKYLGTVSLFHVIDKLLVVPPGSTPPQNRLPMLEMWVTAVWVREAEDDGRRFDFETRLLLPPDETIFLAGEGAFSFAGDFHRTRSIVFGPVPLQEPGVIRAQHRIRPVGTNDWMVQEYPIIVERQEDSDVPATPLEADATGQG